MGNDLEGSDRSVITALSHHLPGRTEEDEVKHIDFYSVFNVGIFELGYTCFFFIADICRVPAEIQTDHLPNTEMRALP
jgi:hypothetical protein